MRAIWKFELPQRGGTVTMPEGAVIRKVGLQYGVACLWAEVDTEAGNEERTFLIFGTGHPLIAKRPLQYAGTVFEDDAGTDVQFVWHIYEEVDGRG